MRGCAYERRSRDKYLFLGIDGLQCFSERSVREILRLWYALKGLEASRISELGGAELGLTDRSLARILLSLADSGLILHHTSA